MIASKGFDVGSLVAPVWPGTVGDSAMGDEEQTREVPVGRARWLAASPGIFNEHGVRKYGVIRIDSAEFGVEKWREDPEGQHQPRSPTRSAKPPRSPPTTASDWPPKAKSAGPACTAGKTCSTCSKRSACPRRSASRPTWPTPICTCWATTRPNMRLLHEGYTDDEFYAAYEKMTDKLRPWTIDFHVAQNDGEVHGAGAHDKTGKHCPADDPNGKLDIAKCAGYWLKDAADARHQAHLLGRLHVPQRDARRPQDLEHDSGHDDQGPRRPRLGLSSIAIDHVTEIDHDSIKLRSRI